MRVNPAVLLLGAAAAVALLMGRSKAATNGGGGGGGGNGGGVKDPNSPAVAPVTEREKRGYQVLGYSIADMEDARVAFAGDLAPVAIAFGIGPAGDAGSRAVQFAGFALGRANNMSTQERTAVVRYLETGEAPEPNLLKSGVDKSVAAWRATVLQTKQGTSGGSNLTDQDQTEIQLRVMYILGYLTPSEFDSVLGRADLGSVFALQRSVFVAQSSAVLAKYRVAQFGGVGEKAVLFLTLILTYAKISAATSQAILAEANQANLTAAPQVGLQTRNALITVKNVLLASAGA